MEQSSYRAASARSIAQQVRDGHWTATEVTDAALAEIGRLNPELNAFTVVLADEARAEARRVGADAALRQGPLAGVPIVIKAELDVAGQVTTFGGHGNSTPAAADCRVVSRLRAAGAVIVGITTMPEFGQFPFTEPQRFGQTINPVAPRHTVGGSSGGSAAAVASGMVPVAIGGDGGGSIRIPAACCGLFGHKGTRGLVSPSPAKDFWGPLALSGPLSRDVADSALVYDVIAGNEATDTYQLPERATELLPSALTDPRRLRIGWTTRSAGHIPVDRQVAEATERFAHRLSELGHQVVPLAGRLPNHAATFLPLMLAGVLEEAEAVEHPERLERLTRAGAARGRLPGQRRAAQRAEAACEALATRLDDLLGEADILLTPTLTRRIPPLGQLDGVSWSRAIWRSVPMSSFTSLANVTGHPAASLPASRDGDGLPIGVQVMARRGRDDLLFALAGQVGRSLGWPADPPASRQH
ncbi:MULTISPECIES: amidase [unclassified Luteococcus]|uniref:amidase n=1 Tax=unclassified Luteococcus TaxID=2639923 RepID=UPI00313ED033